MGFEPHSVAGSALKLASQLPLRGPAPSCAPHERGVPLSESPAVGLKSHQKSVLYLERARGFEPLTTSLGSTLGRYSIDHIAIRHDTGSHHYQMVTDTARYRPQQQDTGATVCLTVFLQSNRVSKRNDIWSD